jgi:hypothetical protein
MELLIFFRAADCTSTAQDTSPPFHLSLVIPVYLIDTVTLDRDGHIMGRCVPEGIKTER